MRRPWRHGWGRARRWGEEAAVAMDGGGCVVADGSGKSNGNFRLKRQG